MSKKITLLLLGIPLSLIHAKIKEPSYPERMFQLGQSAFDARDLATGKNAWVKYRFYCRLSPEECLKDQKQRVDLYFSNLAAKETVVAKVSVVDVPQTQDKSVPVRKKQTKEPRAKLPTPSLTPPDPSRLIKQAERAREQGQLESALRFYQLAEKINPNTQEFASEIEGLKKAME